MWSAMMWIANRSRAHPKHRTPIINRDPYWYTGKVKGAIHIRLQPNNINRDSGIEIPEAWCSRSKNTTTGESYDSEPSKEQLEDLNKPNTAVEKKPTNHCGASCFISRPETIRPYRLMKTSSMQSKRRDSHHKWPHRETNDNTLLLLLCFTTMNKHNLFTKLNSSHQLENAR